MVQQIKEHQLWLPRIVLGLFIGRVFSELCSSFFIQSWGVSGTVGFTAVSLTITLLIFRQKRLPLWLTAVLLPYLFAPASNLPLAVFLILLFLLAFALHTFPTAPSLHHQRVFQILLLATFLLLYATTIAPGILPADSGEFQLVAATGGVAHPPGFPLYTLLTVLLTRLAGRIDFAFTVSLFSLMTSTATLMVVHQTIIKLTKNQIAAITAVIALGTATTFWAQATTANIRSLTGLFTAIFLSQLLHFHQAKAHQKDKYLARAALALGLGLGHHPSLLFIGFVGTIYLLIQDKYLIVQPKRWIRPLLFGAIGAVPFLYLPLRASSGTPGATAGLATWSGFWHHALARGFGNDLFYFIQPAALWQRIKVMGNVMTFQFSVWLLLGMLLGFLWLLVKERKLAWLFGGSFFLHALITATYRAPQTVEYMLPAYVPAILMLGYSIGHIDAWKQRTSGTIFTTMPALITAVFLLAAIYQGVAHYDSYRQLHTTTNTHDYAQTIFDAAPDGATILSDWHWFSPLRYLQQVEGQRPDLAIHLVSPGEGLYGDTWATRIEAELQNGRSVIATHFDAKAYANLPVSEPVGEAYLFAQAPRTTVPTDFAQVNLPLPGVGTINGYALSSQSVEMGAETAVTLAWHSDTNSNLPLYAHLIGFDGRLYAQDDLTVIAQADSIMMTQFKLTPRPGATAGDYAIFVGSGAERVQLTTLTVTPMRQPPVTQQPVNWIVAGERPFTRIIGYDWDHTLPDQTRLYLHWQTQSGFYTEVFDNDAIATLNTKIVVGAWGIHQSVGEQIRPASAQHYVPLGQGIVWIGGGLGDEALIPETAVAIHPTFSSSQPILHDLAISVRLIGFEEDGFHWNWTDLNDSIPAMGAIPTLKWIAGSQVQSPHMLRVSPDAANGQTVSATLILYDAFTNVQLPILDERLVLQAPWIPLGTTTIAE
jgi:hypothetical protein